MLTTNRIGIPLGSLGVFFDGLSYIEVARSYPLPYSAQGPEYVVFSPGYPALIYLARQITPSVPFDWGLLALLASWFPAALATAVFYALCKQVGTQPFWPSVAFVVANPGWVNIASTPRPSSLAMLFTLLCFVAYLRGRSGWSVLWLSLSGIARIQSLLVGAALAFGVLILRRDIRIRSFGLLALPLIAFGLVHLYMSWRVPGFRGVWEAHQFFWVTELTWPFAAWIEHAKTLPWQRPQTLFWVNYLTLAVYLLAIPVGLRRRERALWFLPVMVAVIVGFHVSLSGFFGPRAFTRFAVLSWPAALLILWRWQGERLPNTVAALLCTAALGVSLMATIQQNAGTINWQRSQQPFVTDALLRIGENEPYWVDFRRERNEFFRKKMQAEGSGAKRPPRRP